MMILQCPDLSENKFVSIYTNFKDSTYRLTFNGMNIVIVAYLVYMIQMENQ